MKEPSVLHQLVAFMAANELDTLSTNKTVNGYTVYISIEPQQEIENGSSSDLDEKENH